MKIETDEKSVGMRSRIRERSIGGREGEDMSFNSVVSISRR